MAEGKISEWLLIVNCLNHEEDSRALKIQRHNLFEPIAVFDSFSSVCGRTASPKGFQ
jgi:hypothetical protein